MTNLSLRKGADSMDRNPPARRETFDLTPEPGRKRAVDTFDRWGWLGWLAPVPGVGTFWLLKKGYDFITQREIDTLEEQKKAAIDLIKAGSQQQDLAEMQITMDQRVGFDLGSELEGIPVKAKYDKRGHMIVEAKYKH
jgi:hypothetical protein